MDDETYKYLQIKKPQIQPHFIASHEISAKLELFRKEMSDMWKTRK